LGFFALFLALTTLWLSKQRKQQDTDYIAATAWHLYFLFVLSFDPNITVAALLVFTVWIQSELTAA
jgi:hypothetical protein